MYMYMYMYIWEVHGNYGEMYEVGIPISSRWLRRPWWGYGYALTFDASVDEEVVKILLDRELIPEGGGSGEDTLGGFHSGVPQ